MQCNTNQKRNEYYIENKKSERAHNFTAESIYFVLWICMLYMYICVFYEARSLFRLVAINSSDVNDEKCAQIHTLHWLPTESPQRTMVAIEYYYFIRFSCSVFFCCRIYNTKRRFYLLLRFVVVVVSESYFPFARTHHHQKWICSNGISFSTVFWFPGIIDGEKSFIQLLSGHIWKVKTIKSQRDISHYFIVLFI